MTVATSAAGRKRSITSGKKRRTSLLKSASSLERTALLNNAAVETVSVPQPLEPVVCSEPEQHLSIQTVLSGGESLSEPEPELPFAPPAACLNNPVSSTLDNTIISLATPAGTPAAIQTILPSSSLLSPQVSSGTQALRIDRTSFIKETARRNRTYYKRKEYLFSKVREISAMTGAEVLLIISNPVTGTVTPLASSMFEPLLHTPYGMTLVSQCMSGASWKAAMIKQQGLNPDFMSQNVQVPGDIADGVAYRAESSCNQAPSAANMASIYNILNHDDDFYEDNDDQTMMQLNMENDENARGDQNELLRQLLQTLP